MMRNAFLKTLALLAFVVAIVVGITVAKHRADDAYYREAMEQVEADQRMLDERRGDDYATPRR